jgi:adenine deaminase
MMAAMSLESFIRRVPKVELHMHIEGSLEPELVFALAARNGITLPYPSVEVLRAAYQFHNLQSFLDIYYAGTSVLVTEQDFYDMTAAYLARAAEDNVQHTEIFFDPQSHLPRGVSMATVIGGIGRALDDARAQHGMTSEMILCFLRHLSEEDAFATLEAAKPFVSRLKGVGLDSSEVGHPPSKFQRVYAAARALGLRPVAHAGEEGPPAYIREALDLLHVERIDHGVRCLEDDALTDEIVSRQIPLTVCPLSNLKLCVVRDMKDHNLARLLERGVCATVNSDDPAYFGGYMTDNFLAVARALPIGQAEVVKLCENAVRASFADEARKAELLAAIHAARVV